MRYDITEIGSYVEKSLLSKCDHKTLPISIYKYSRNCQFERIWDSVTLNMRGTVLDDKGNIVARTFPKFFNVEEEPDYFSDLPFEVFEKLDGSLGILFHYSGEWHLATQGSFYSDQAIYAQSILARNETYKDIFSEKYTFLFEIIYPQNRIVCHYGSDEKLVLLAAIKTDNGRETPYDELKSVAERTGFECVKRYDGIKDLAKIKEMIGDNQEGFVIRYSDGKRRKVKGEEYVRLHKLMTAFSNLDIWDCLRKGTDYRKLMENIPDEYDQWIREIEKELISKYTFIDSVIKYEYEEIIKRMKLPRPSEEEYLDRNSPLVKSYNKEFYELVKDNPIRNFLFSLHNRMEYSDNIWKQIRPDYQKPFWASKEN